MTLRQQSDALPVRAGGGGDFFRNGSLAGDPSPFMEEKRRQLDCSLLVPRELIREFDVPPPRLGNLIEFLLRVAGDSAGGRHSGTHLTVRYQPSDATLQKLNFRVRPVIWHQLGCYARVLGVSRCFAFVLLLREHLRRQSEGTPAKLPKYQRHYLLYYDLVRISAGTTTIVRRRKFIDNALEYRMKRAVARSNEELMRRLRPPDPEAT